MIIGIFLFLLSVYFLIQPHSLLFSGLPLELLGIEEPKPWYTQIYEYPINKFNDYYNYFRNFTFYMIVKNLFNFSISIIIGFSNIIFFTSSFIKNIIDLTSYLSLAIVLGSLSWVSLQFFFWTEEIIELANTFMVSTPGIPSLVAMVISFFYLRFLDPFMTVLENGGNQLEAFMSLIPTEPQLLLWSNHIVTVISNQYQMAWSNAACAFIDLLSIPIKIGPLHLDVTGLFAKTIISVLNPIFGVGIPTVLEKIAKIFLRWL